MKKFFNKLINNWLIRISKEEVVLFNNLTIKITNRRRNALVGYLFIGIWLIGFFWFAAIPLVRSLIFSFQKVTITGGSGIQQVANGFKNYLTIFSTDIKFLRLLQEFVVQLLLYVPVILIVSMIIAMMLNQNIRFRGFFRSIFFLPVVIVSGPVIGELLNQGAGSAPLLNTSVLTESITNLLPGFLAQPLTSLFTETIMILWFSGVQIVLFLAGLQRMDREIYEAAEIDGASAWEKFWKITLPSMKPIILVTAVYTVVMLATFSNNGIIKYIQSSEVMYGTDKGYGYTSALAWIYFIVIIIILGILVFLLGNRKEKDLSKKKIRKNRR